MNVINDVFKKSVKMCNIIFSDKFKICVGENNCGMYGIMLIRV